MHDNRTDTVIIGAGPAGLQLAYFFQKAGRPYVVLERGETPGTFFTRFPRHRKLISVNKVYTGQCDTEMNYRWDWNSLLCDEPRLLFKNYSKQYFPPADHMVQYLTDFARHHALNIEYGVDVDRIARVPNGRGDETESEFVISTRGGHSHKARRVVVATGVSKPYIPAIPGIELAEQYVDISVNPDDFINQRVLIIGKGNSGFETAECLMETTAVIHVASPRPVKFAWQSHFVGHLRAVNNNLLDTYLLKCQNATLEVEILNIERRGNRFAVSVQYQRAAGSRDVIEYDRVICATGFRLDTDIFDETCRPEVMISDRFPRMDSSWQSVNVPGLYFAGTLMQANDFKKTSSGFIHGFRYNVRALALMMQERDHDERIPYREVAMEAEATASAVLDRVNRSSALWQQFGFLADILAVDPENGCLRYYEAFPIKYAHEHPLGGLDEYYAVTLEYGFTEDDDPFKSMRVSHTDAAHASDSTFLHPIIRRYRRGELIDECHVVENLEAKWNDPTLHVKPLVAYFKNAFSSIRASRVSASRGGARRVESGVPSNAENAAQ